jgi:hypothetical protein
MKLKLKVKEQFINMFRIYRHKLIVLSKNVRLELWCVLRIFKKGIIFLRVDCSMVCTIHNGTVLRYGYTLFHAYLMPSILQILHLYSTDYNM